MNALLERARRKRTAVPPVGRAFRELVEASPSRGVKGSPSWKKWPKKAREEVQEVTKLNDEGKASVSASSMLGYLKSRYNVTATRNELNYFVTRGLGRTSWRNP